jgi:hypothetical protein
MTAVERDPRPCETCRTMPAPGQHAYGVRQVVDAWGVLRYQAWCDCGWEGVPIRPTRPRPKERAAAERQAATDAFIHATGREPEPNPPLPRRRVPPQPESLFDATPYEPTSRRYPALNPPVAD